MIGQFVTAQGLVSFEDALIDALSGKMAFGFPVVASIIGGLTQKTNRPGVWEGFSASQLQYCGRKVILDALEPGGADKLEGQYWMSRGTMVHKIIEDALTGLPDWLRPFFLHEQRLKTDILLVDGRSIALSGQFDLVYLPPAAEDIAREPRCMTLPTEAILYDHKNTKRVPTLAQGAKDEHLWQASIYAYLMYVNDWPIVPRIVAINYMDNGKAVEFRRDLYEYDEVEEYLQERLLPLADAFFQGTLPSRALKADQWQCNGYCPHTSTCWPSGINSSPDGYSGRTFIPIKDLIPVKNMENVA